MSSICLRLIVKNGSITLKETLKSWINIIDYWVIVDTGSDDDSIDIIYNTLKNIPGELHQIKYEHFDFSKARNDCLDINKFICKWNIMIDDSYKFSGKKSFKKHLENIPLFNCLAIEIIGECNVSYFSKRLTRSASLLRYQGAIHEDIYCDYFLFKHFKIIDLPGKSSIDRFFNDVKLLGETPRDLFLKGCTYRAIYNHNHISDYKNEAILNFNKRLNIPTDFEEHFMCYIYLASFFLEEDNPYRAIDYFKYALKVYPNRAGECYFFIYKITQNEKFLKLAKDHPLGIYKLQCPTRLYNELKNM
jgi:tetratricopeptide (TPR) repeat protein